MAGSLFDQLKKSGLVSDKKAKQVQHQKRQQATKNKQQAKKGKTVENEAAKLAAKAAEEKAQRDRELNQTRQQQQAENAKKAELRQIIISNLIKGFEGDITYNFADGNSVKSLNVNAKTQKALANEKLLIVRFDKGYKLVPAEVADKIEQRDANAIVRNQSQENKLSKEDQDYYAQFEIPDDLVW